MAFLILARNGVAIGTAGLSLPPGAANVAAAPQDSPNYYPPELHGLRGSHPGSFETAHSLRDGAFWDHAKKRQDDHAVYDLIVVGAGISGLSAAYFFLQAKPNAKILILDNHDDFGGHAKRNEYHLNGKLELLHGGTEEIDSPRPYSKVAAGLLTALGIDPVALAAKCEKNEIFKGLAPSTFFDWETFGRDALIVGRSRGEEDGTISWQEFLSHAPLSLRAIKQMVRAGEGLSAGQAQMLRLPALIEALRSEDQDEGVRAFQEKRAPQWRGR